MSNPGRCSIRLPGYDYSQPGAYFVMICSYQKQHIFGQVIDQKITLSVEGRIVQEEWLRTQDLRQEVILDAFVIMPSHLHAIIFIRDQVRAHGHAPVPLPGHIPILQRQPRSLGSLTARFKGSVTRRVRKVRDNPLLCVWQRNYYERIIRNEKELNAIRRYITEYPARWELRT